MQIEWECHWEKNETKKKRTRKPEQLSTTTATNQTVQQRSFAMLAFFILSHISLYVALAFCALCLATGLYYLSELAEEYSVMTKRVLRTSLWVRTYYTSLSSWSSFDIFTEKKTHTFKGGHCCTRCPLLVRSLPASVHCDWNRESPGVHAAVEDLPAGADSIQGVHCQCQLRILAFCCETV